MASDPLQALAEQASGLGALTQAIGRARTAHEQFVASQATGARAAAAATMNAAKSVDGVGASADKLIGKRAALRDAIGGGLGNALGAAQQLGGPLGAIASKVQNIASLFGRVPPQVALVIAAVVALVAVVGGAAAALYKLGETAVDVVQKASMLRSVLGALHGSADVGGKLQGLINSLGGRLPFATEKIAEWAKSLSMVAQTSGQLSSMVQAVAAAQALMGESGASAAQKMFETLGRGGQAAASLVAKLKMGLPDAREELAGLGLKVGDVAKALGLTEAQFKSARISADQMNAALQKALQQKGAGPLGEMALTWPVIIMKAKEGLMSLFTDLGPAVKPFMAAVKSLFGEFSRGGAIINILKPIATAVFGTLFSWAQKAVNVAHRGFLMLVIAGIQAYIAVRPLIAAFGKLWDAIVKLLVAVGVLDALGSSTGVLSAIWNAFTGTLGATVSFLTMTVDGIASAITWLTNLGSAASAAGSSIIDGLLGFDPSAFVAKMAAMASQGLAAFKSVLGIASPSKVMLEHGEKNIAGAAATGIDRGADKVDASMAKMGGAEPSGAAGARGKGTTITIGQLIVQVGEREDADSFFERFVALLNSQAAEATT